MAYSIRLPDGTLVENIPDEVTPEAAKARLLQLRPDLLGAPPPERTWGEAAKDVAAGVVKGAGNLIQLPGQLYGLATGNFENTGLLGAGKAVSDLGESMKSQGLRAREAGTERRVQDVEASKGQIAAFLAQARETITDPAQLTNFIAEQLPSLVLSGGSATITKSAVQRASQNLSAEAAKAAALKAGTRAAVGANVVQQGADVGAGAYEQVYQYLTSKGVPPEEAAAQAINKARAAGVTGAALSLLANKLPGGQAMERVLAGERTGLGRVAGFAAGALKEAPGEILEEGGGRMAQNAALRAVNPEQSLMQGVGATAGKAAVGGIGLGGITGMVGGSTPPAPPAPPGLPPLPSTPASETEIGPAPTPPMPTSYGELKQREQSLLQEEQTAEVKQELAAVREELKKLNLTELQRLNEQAQIGKSAEERAKEAGFPAEQSAKAFDTEGAQLELREAIPTEPIKPATDLFGNPVAPAPDEAAPTLGDLVDGVPFTTEALTDAGMMPSPKDLQEQGQMSLDFGRRTKKQPAEAAPAPAEPAVAEEEPAVAPGEDNTEPVLKPKRVRAKKQPAVQPEAGEVLQPAEEPATGVFTEQDIKDTGIPTRTSIKWLLDNVVGKTEEEVRALIAKDPKLVEGPGQRAKILQALTQPKVPAFQETPNAPEVAQPEATAGVEEPAAVAAPVDTGAGAGAAVPVPPAKRTRAKRAKAPEQPGVAPTGQPAVPADGGAPESAPALTQETADEEATRLREAEEVKQRMAEVAKESQKRPVEIPEASPAKPAAAKKRAKKEAEAPAEVVEADKAAEAEVQKARDMLAKLEEREDATLDETDRFSIQTAIKEGRVDEAVASMRDISRRMREKLYAQPGDPTSSEVGKSQEDYEFEGAAAKELQGMNVDEAAKWAAARLPKGWQRMIAQRLVPLMAQLTRAGVTFAPIKVTGEGMALTSGASGVTVLEAPDAKVRAATVRIILNHPSNGPRSGTTPELVLHELIHAATFAVVQIGRYHSSKGTKLHALANDLIDVSRATIDFYRSRKGTPAATTRLEKAVQNGANALASQDEVLAWGLSSEAMQEFMEMVPYKGKTAWTKFVETVRSMLGLPPKADTALAGLMRVFEDLTNISATDIEAARLQSGRAFAVAPSTEALVDSMGPLEAPERGALGRMIDAFKSQGGVDYATAGRVLAVDSAAAIEAKFRKEFDGAVRNAAGLNNPMGLYRQAQDYTKMLLEYFRQGSLVKDKTLGLWRVTQDPKVRPPLQVYEKLQAWAKQNGYTSERGTQVASRVLEGVRLDAMRASNKAGKTDFILHMSDAQIDQLVAEYKADPALQELSTLMDEARKAMVDNMVAVGRLTPEDGRSWKEVVGYVPFERIEDFATKFSAVKKVGTRGLAQLGKLPELVGSKDRPVGNVFDNYINTLGWMVGQTVKADANLTTLRALQRIGHAQYLGPSNQHKQNTVMAYVDGEPRYWELPSKYDVMAFKDLSLPKTGIIKAMSEFSNVLRKSVTVLPPFALKQVTDDIQRAIMTSGVRNPWALVRMSLVNFPKLALAELRGIQHPTVQEFGALGLTGEYDFQAGKPAASLLKDHGYKPRGVFEALLHRLDGITRASDLSVRKAIYDQTMRETKDQLLAQTRAREFINFRRRGASDTMATLTATIPFFNAYVQGMDVLYRAASGKDSSSSVGRAQARRMFWSRAATVVAFSTMYAIMMSDDDDYNQMDLRTRDGSWILPGGHKLPVPGELGAVFKVIPERVVEYMKRQGTPEEQEASAAVRSALSYMWEQYGGRVSPVPQAVKPLIEAWANTSFLTGRSLEGFHHQTMAKSMRRTDSTSELASAISDFARDVIGTEVSPIMIDNTLRGYFGSTAALTTMVTDAMLNPTRVDRPLHKWALLSNYLVDPVGTRAVSEFYEEREKVSEAGATLRELAKTDPDKVEDYIAKHEDELALEVAVNSTLEQLERTRAYRKFLTSPEGAREMSKEERAEELQEIRKMEVELTGWVREVKATLAKQRQ